MVKLLTYNFHKTSHSFEMLQLIHGLECRGGLILCHDEFNPIFDWKFERGEVALDEYSQHSPGRTVIHSIKPEPHEFWP